MFCTVLGSFDLILVARDEGNPKPFQTLRFLNIVIVDANENRPEFSDSSNPYRFSVAENGIRDLKIGTIQATTPIARRNRLENKNIFYYLLMGNEDGAFEVDRNTGEIYTNISLDRYLISSNMVLDNSQWMLCFGLVNREKVDVYTLYILASIKADLEITDAERSSYSGDALKRDTTVAKVLITVLDENDNAPIFAKDKYYAGVSAKAPMGAHIISVNASDLDAGPNASIEYTILSSNLYKFGSSKSKGSIVPSPFCKTYLMRLHI